jgi:hypothetical protein
MKFIVRRFIASVVSLPFALGLYGLVYFGLALVANSYASVGLFAQNCYAVGFAWVVAVTFAPQFLKLVDKVSE